MKNILIIIFLINTQLVLSQNNEVLSRRNAFTLEFIGHSEALISINYERLFSTNNVSLMYTLRTGLGRIPGYEVQGKKF